MLNIVIKFSDFSPLALGYVRYSLYPGFLKLSSYYVSFVHITCK